MASIKAALSDKDARRALAAFQTIRAGREGYAPFVGDVLDRLAELVGSDLTTLSLCDLERGTRSVVIRSCETQSVMRCVGPLKCVL